MSDLISRQAALDALKGFDVDIIPYGHGKMYVQETINAIFLRLSNLPSAEPERKKGKWIEQDDGWDGVYYECSCCKEAFTLLDGTPSDNLYNFCPNCGADMRGE